MRVAVVFPGQGSQRPAWATDWDPGGATPPLPTAATAVLGPDRVEHLLLEPAADVSGTEDAQLSVLLASSAIWDQLRPWLDEVDVVAVGGHSLGQLTALLAAAAVPPEQGIALAAARARASAEAQAADPGGMVALFPTTEDVAIEVVDAVPGRAWLANLNGAGQLVVGAEAAALDDVETRAKQAGVRRVQRLPVDGAFHTPLMEPAAAVVRAAAEGVAFDRPLIPILDNLDGGLLVDADGWPERLARHLVSPVRWDLCGSTLAGLAPDVVIEVGPAPALAPLLRRALPDVDVATVTSAADAAAIAGR